MSNYRGFVGEFSHKLQQDKKKRDKKEKLARKKLLSTMTSEEKRLFMEEERLARKEDYEMEQYIKELVNPFHFASAVCRCIQKVGIFIHKKLYERLCKLENRPADFMDVHERCNEMCKEAKVPLTEVADDGFKFEEAYKAHVKENGGRPKTVEAVFTSQGVDEKVFNPDNMNSWKKRKRVPRKETEMLK